MLAKQKLVLHKLNVWHVKTLDLAFESAVHFSKWSEALKYGNKLLIGFKYAQLNIYIKNIRQKS